MNMALIDTLLDYFRLAAYSVVLLAALKGIVHRNFTNLLFIGDIIMVIGLIITLVYGHLFGLSRTLGDEILLTTVATAWATIHFISMLRDTK